MNTVFYLASIIILFILFCVIKKKDKTIDIIPSIIITFLCLLAYQVLVCIMFSSIKISINLISLSITNTIFIIISLFILKNRGMQSFKTSKRDLLITCILIIVVSLISYYNVGKLERIRYYSTDASIHYISAKEFYQNENMLNKTEGTETAKQLMPIAYVNVGILFKAFEPVIGEMNFYKIFILFDIIILCFSIILFYYIIKDNIEKKSNLLLAVIVSIIYIIGYPLNNFLNGFYYLGVGCLAISSIIYILKQKEYNKIITLFFLNTTLILSYSLFAPVIYLSLFIYYIYVTYKAHKKIFNKELIINTIMTLIIPGMIGVLFLIIPNVETVKCISLEGYIYKNLIINIIVFIPFVIYSLYIIIKNKNIDYKFIYFSVLLTYIIILFIGVKTEIVSEYYFYKNAYILWEIILIYFFEGIITFNKNHEKKNYIANLYVFAYTILLVISVITNKHILPVYDLYEANYELLHYQANLTKDDLEMLEYIYNNDMISKTENNILFIGNFMQEAWIRSIFKYRNRYPLEASNHREYVEKWNKGEYDYLVCFEERETYQILENSINLEGRTLTFETGNTKLYVK